MVTIIQHVINAAILFETGRVDDEQEEDVDDNDEETHEEKKTGSDELARLDRVVDEVLHVVVEVGVVATDIVHPDGRRLAGLGNIRLARHG